MPKRETDQIAIYTTLVSDGVRRWCQSCQVERLVWAGQLQSGYSIMACATCQRVLEAACEHGTAMDVHCCNCHSGFIFDSDHLCEDPAAPADGDR